MFNIFGASSLTKEDFDKMSEKQLAAYQKLKLRNEEIENFNRQLTTKLVNEHSSLSKGLQFFSERDLEKINYLKKKIFKNRIDYVKFYTIEHIKKSLQFIFLYYSDFSKIIEIQDPTKSYEFRRVSNRLWCILWAVNQISEDFDVSLYSPGKETWEIEFSKDYVESYIPKNLFTSDVIEDWDRLIRVEPELRNVKEDLFLFKTSLRGSAALVDFIVNINNKEKLLLVFEEIIEKNEEMESLYRAHFWGEEFDKIRDQLCSIFECLQHLPDMSFALYQNHEIEHKKLLDDLIGCE